MRENIDRTNLEALRRLMGAPAPRPPPRQGLAAPGGLAQEIRSDGVAQRGAATGFAVALARRACGTTRHLLWIQEGQAAREGGGPYGPGLAAFGLDPARLLLLRAPAAAEALWAAEEGVATSALGAVLLELDGAPAALTVTALRRLKLRAEVSGAALLLLRHGARALADDGLPADLRWRVAGAPSAEGGRHALGRPAWRATLERNRLGSTAVLDLAWDAYHAEFRPLPWSRPAAAPPRPLDAERAVLPLVRAG